MTLFHLVPVDERVPCEALDQDVCVALGVRPVVVTGPLAPRREIYPMVSSDDGLAIRFIARNIQLRGAKFSLTTRPMHHWGAHIVVDPGASTERQCFQYGDSPALAICRAALEAFGSREVDG